MSRSYKRTPVCKWGGRIGGTRKFWKRQANRKVRRTKALSGKSSNYRKLYESWNIRDYRFYQVKYIGMDEDELSFWRQNYFAK